MKEIAKTLGSLDFAFGKAVDIYLNPEHKDKEIVLEVLEECFKKEAAEFVKENPRNEIRLKIHYLPLMFYGGQEPTAVRAIARRFGYGLTVEDIPEVNRLIAEGLLTGSEDNMRRIQSEIANIAIEAVYREQINDNYNNRWIDGFEFEERDKDYCLWFNTTEKEV